MHICLHLNIICKPADRSQILKNVPPASFCLHPTNRDRSQCVCVCVCVCVKLCSAAAYRLQSCSERHVCSNTTCDYLASARLAVLMWAVRIAFIEDNINLTLNFHLIFGARTHGACQGSGCIASRCFQVTYCPLVWWCSITGGRLLWERLSDISIQNYYCFWTVGPVELSLSD